MIIIVAFENSDRPDQGLYTGIKTKRKGVLYVRDSLRSSWICFEKSTRVRITMVLQGIVVASRGYDHHGTHFVKFTKTKRFPRSVVDFKFITI